MKYLFIVFAAFLLISCSDSFINHSLKAEKAGACTEQPTPVRMISNINGERYEFVYCLNEDFTDKDYSIERIGDSLLVKFPQPRGTQVSYKLTLDVDAKPPYRFITLGEAGPTIPMKAAERL